MRQRGIVSTVQADAQWKAPECPLIILRQQVQIGIENEVMRGFNALPKRGAEVGGILLGSRNANGIVIEEYEPVLCEYRFGPSFQLSESDERGLENLLEQARGGGLRPVGMYRSSTSPEFGLTPADEQLFQKYCGDPGQVLLWIKPRRLQHSEADFFVWREGKLVEASSPQPFPFAKVLSPGAATGAPPPAEPAQAGPPRAPEPVPAVAPKPAAPTPERPRIVLPEPVRSRRLDDEDEERDYTGSRGFWIALAVLALVVAIGGVLGYRSFESRNPSAPPVAPARQPAPAPVQQRAAAPPPPAQITPPPPTESVAPSQPEPKAETAPPAPPAVEPGPERRPPRAREAVADSPNQLLERWMSALRSGNLDAAAQCYAPRLVEYHTRRHATRADVRASLARMVRMNGVFQIVRLSDIRIVPDGRGRVVASFRKHWQTSRMYAGEERDRLTMVKSSGGWQIDSERELQVYWVHGR